jgi:hypothetical protein
MDDDPASPACPAVFNAGNFPSSSALISRAKRRLKHLVSTGPVEQLTGNLAPAEFNRFFFETVKCSTLR